MVVRGVFGRASALQRGLANQPIKLCGVDPRHDLARGLRQRRHCGDTRLRETLDLATRDARYTTEMIACFQLLLRKTRPLSVVGVVCRIGLRRWGPRILIDEKGLLDGPVVVKTINQRYAFLSTITERNDDVVSVSLLHRFEHVRITTQLQHHSRLDAPCELGVPDFIVKITKRTRTRHLDQKVCMTAKTVSLKRCLGNHINTGLQQLKGAPDCVYVLGSMTCIGAGLSSDVHDSEPRLAKMSFQGIFMGKPFMRKARQQSVRRILVHRLIGTLDRKARHPGRIGACRPTRKVCRRENQGVVLVPHGLLVSPCDVKFRLQRRSPSSATICNPRASIAMSMALHTSCLVMR